MTRCRECGGQHDEFLDAVCCDIEHHGAERTRARFMQITDAIDLIALTLPPIDGSKGTP